MHAQSLQAYLTLCDPSLGPLHSSSRRAGPSWLQTHPTAWQAVPYPLFSAWNLLFHHLKLSCKVSPIYVSPLNILKQKYAP